MVGKKKLGLAGQDGFLIHRSPSVVFKRVTVEEGSDANYRKSRHLRDAYTHSPDNACPAISRCIRQLANQSLVAICLLETKDGLRLQACFQEVDNY